MRFFLPAAALLGMAAGIVLVAMGKGRTPEAWPGARVITVCALLTRELQLDGAQSAKVARILAEAGRAAQPVHQELREVRGELIRALRQGRDARSIRELNREEARAAARLAALETAALAEVLRVLDVRQRIRAEDVLARLESILPPQPAHGAGGTARHPPEPQVFPMKASRV